MTLYWIASGYLFGAVLTVLIMRYCPPRMEFAEGTTLQRRVSGTILVLLLWPLVWIYMMFFARIEQP
jgi:hypothetical protein